MADGKPVRPEVREGWQTEFDPVSTIPIPAGPDASDAGGGTHHVDIDADVTLGGNPGAARDFTYRAFRLAPSGGVLAPSMQLSWEGAQAQVALPQSNQAERIYLPILTAPAAGGGLAQGANALVQSYIVDQGIPYHGGCTIRVKQGVPPVPVTDADPIRLVAVPPDPISPDGRTLPIGLRTVLGAAPPLPPRQVTYRATRLSPDTNQNLQLADALVWPNGTTTHVQDLTTEDDPAVDLPLSVAGLEADFLAGQCILVQAWTEGDKFASCIVRVKHVGL